MLEIRGLYKSYKNFKVLDGLDMKINKGDIYGFLGKNGCGKTTTMNIICNIIPKDEGEVIIGENSSPDAPDKKIKIGYLPESPLLYDYMNGYEYLGYVAYAAKYTGDVKARIDEVLALTGMTEGGKRRIKGYSRGMNQRLGIAAAIFDDPELLILDEPTSALDPEGRAEVMSIIQRLAAAGCTILLCTHILGDVERVANRIGILSGGKLAVQGGIQEIIDRYRSDSVELLLSADDPENNLRIAKLFSGADFVKSSNYYEKTNRLILEVDDIKAGMKAAMLFAAQNSADVDSISVSRPTLEQVYLDIVGR